MNRILVVGDSLFAATLFSMLATTFEAAIVESAPDVSCALPLAAASQFDVAILADTQNASLPPDFVDLMCGSLPVIIHTSLQQDFLGVFYYQRINAGVSDLMAVLDLLARAEVKAGQASCLHVCQNLVEGESL